MVCVVEVVHVEAAVVVVAVGVITTGAGHGLLCSSSRQLTEAPLETMLTPLPTVRAGLRSAQPWDTTTQTMVNQISIELWEEATLLNVGRTCPLHIVKPRVPTWLCRDSAKQLF